MLNCLEHPEFRIIKLHIKSCECSFKEMGSTKCYINVSFNYSIDIIRFPHLSSCVERMASGDRDRTEIRVKEITVMFP